MSEPSRNAEQLLVLLDALRADVEELDKAYQLEREHTRQLEGQLSDLTDDFHRVMDEDCGFPAERHCSCVPHLRRRIRELEATTVEWRPRRNCHTCARKWKDPENGYHYCLVLDGSELHEAVKEWENANVFTTKTDLSDPKADGCPGWVPTAFLAPAYRGDK